MPSGPDPRIALPVIAGVTGGALWFGPGLAVHWPPAARALGVPLRIPGSSGVVLTFDDGPHPEGTPAVLKALDQAGARATFFLVGEQVERYPGLAARISAEGHEVAVHGHRHRNQMRLTGQAFAGDLERALSVISDACGQLPAAYRPPYGVFTPTGLRAVRRTGLAPVLWSRWGRDWRADRSPGQIASQATGDLRAGDVILLHDADWYGDPGCHRNTATATPVILRAIADLGLSAVTVSEAAPVSC